MLDAVFTIQRINESKPAAESYWRPLSMPPSGALHHDKIKDRRVASHPDDEHPSIDSKLDPSTLFANLLEELRNASWVFQNEEKGATLGIIHACRSLAHFLNRMGLSPELAVPFLHVKEAFEDLDRGVIPPLLTRAQHPSERDRSSERKFHQLWAVVLVEMLMEKEVSEDEAASRVARNANGWANFKSQDVSGSTVKAWRDKLKGSSKEERAQFEKICESLRAQPETNKMIEQVLREGPPGVRGKT